MRDSGLRRWPRGAVMLLLVGCGACATVGTEAPPLRAFKTVGVISAVGDTLTVTTSGLTAPGNSKRAYSIESWRLDDLIVSRAGALLSRRFHVQPVTYRRPVFATLDRNNPVVVVNLLRKDRIADLVRTEAMPQGLDAYVVITRGTSTYGNSGRLVGGIGVVHHSALLNAYDLIHALYVVRVVDGHTFSLLDKRSAPPLDNTDIMRLGGPSRMVDDAFLPAGTGPAESEKLKAAVTDLVERSLPATLETLRLLDPDFAR